MNTPDIREHMKVIGSDRQPVGTVDHLEGDRIKLSRSSIPAAPRYGSPTIRPQSCAPTRTAPRLSTARSARTSPRPLASRLEFGAA
jgi:hypothetical protein